MIYLMISLLIMILYHLFHYRGVFPVDVSSVFPVYQICFLYLGTEMFITPQRCLFITPEVDVREEFEIPEIDVSDVPEVFDVPEVYNVPDVFDVSEVYPEMSLRFYFYVMLSI